MQQRELSLRQLSPIATFYLHMFVKIPFDSGWLRGLGGLLSLLCFDCGLFVVFFLLWQAGWAQWALEVPSNLQCTVVL